MCKLWPAFPVSPLSSGLKIQKSLTFLTLLPALGGFGCGGNSQTPGGDMAEQPAFLLGTRVWDDTTTTSYFHLVPSIDPGTSVDTTKAVEVAGAAKLFAVEGVGWFAIGGGEEPTITRYTIGPDGQLAADAKISLQPQGVTGLWDTLYVVSPTKLYYPDRAGGQLVIINPTEMSVEGTVALPQTAREGYLALYGYTPLLRDGKLLFSVGWFDWNVDDKVLGETGLVVLDTASDAVQRFDVDDRCGGITTGVITKSGDAYFVSSALAGAAYRLGRLSTEPCALRLNAKDDAFDESYVARLSDITSKAISGEPIPAGDNAVFLRVFDENAASVEAGDATWELTGQSVWEWWRWDVDTGLAAPIAELPPSTSDVVWFQVDERVFGTETTADYSETTLIELTAEGGPRRALTAPGFLHGLARVR